MLNSHLSYVVIVTYVTLHRAQDEQHAQEVSKFQEELAEAHAQLQILQKQLDEELAKQPLTNQEVWTLKITEIFIWYLKINSRVFMKSVRLFV